MDATEMADGWFVTHGGKQFGPVSIDDLKFEAERGGLSPKLDVVWKKGMKGWIPAGQVEGLFEPNETAGEDEEESISGEEWPGAGRAALILVCFIFPVFWGFCLGLGMAYLQGKVASDALMLGGVGLGLVPIVLAITALLMRFRNLGMNRAWFFGLFAPILNLWIGFRIFACPEGYAEHRKLDGIGWILAFIYWVSVLLAAAATVFVAFTITQSGPDDPNRIAIENFTQHIQKLRELH
jgi:hypothetical protein